MAIRDKNGNLRGRVGNMVYREWKGLNIVQSRPRPFKQTVGTKAAAAEFGMASSTAASIRRAMWRFYQHNDSNMINRLNRSVLKCIQQSKDKERLDRNIHDANLSLLNQFEFNSHSPLKEVLPVIPEAHISSCGGISVNLPAFKQADIKFFGDRKVFTHYKLRIMAIAFDFRNSYAEIVDIRDTIVQEYQPAIQWQPKANIPQGMILIVGMALYAELHINGEIQVQNSASWSPASIIAANHITSSQTSAMNQKERYEFHQQAGSLQHLIPIQKNYFALFSAQLRTDYQSVLQLKRLRKSRLKPSTDLAPGPIPL